MGNGTPQNGPRAVFASDARRRRAQVFGRFVDLYCRDPLRTPRRTNARDAHTTQALLLTLYY